MTEQGLSRFSYKLAGLLAGAVLLAFGFVANIRWGFTSVSWSDTIAALFHYDETSMNQVIVKLTRLPRALIAAAVGASLAVAGVIMQAITRNPLASPSILGINSGAALGVVLGVTALAIQSQSTLVWFAFGGAAIAAATVYALSALGYEGMTPMRIVLAGAAMSALFMSATQGLLVRNQSSLQDVLFWLAGSIAGRPLELLVTVIPYMAVSWLGAWLLSRHLNVLAAGEETAVGVGMRTSLVKFAGGLCIVLLAGSSVAVAGPIGFIGIVIPHVARYLAGLDHRWLIPYSAVLGATLLLLADLAARFVIPPQELPVGVMTAAVGTPFFIYIARRGKVKA
ncbi:FecCD family ABC transporter permease [Cohnella phaseoli]|uniref:Iron complex transport system permease protein n=1 Tax=Cohnella phaseoli TaxID=456490 RepID=A0A3D9IHK6_9BACL|nr:iron ABC transporter permease [Cohnella phaseoli]RED60616.1 iron complex transport system permease protein [Cohnella phaseoli]